MVQDELKRRDSLYSSKNPSRYSSKYALTGKVICGECGAKYRRVTWSRNGNKKIVWRCTERLKNGTKNCKNSPTIFEEDLYNAIRDSLKELLPKSDDIAKRVRDEIEAVLNKNDVNNPRGAQRRIQNLEKEAKILRNILKETNDKELYVDKIKSIENYILILNDRLDTGNKKNTTKEIEKIEDFIETKELNMNHLFESFIKNIVKCIEVNSGQKIRILYL